MIFFLNNWRKVPMSAKFGRFETFQHIFSSNDYIVHDHVLFMCKPYNIINNVTVQVPFVFYEISINHTMDFIIFLGF